jgi:hypothetical protein
MVIIMASRVLNQPQFRTRHMHKAEIVKDTSEIKGWHLNDLEVGECSVSTGNRLLAKDQVRWNSPISRGRSEVRP